MLKFLGRHWLTLVVALGFTCWVAFVTIDAVQAIREAASTEDDPFAEIDAARYGELAAKTGKRTPAEEEEFRDMESKIKTITLRRQQQSGQWKP